MMTADTSITSATLKLVDVLTIAAILIGPVVAISIQLGFERRREIRKSRIAILDTLMAYRGRLGHPDCVSAINRVELAFHGNEQVTSRLRSLIEHMERERNFSSQDEKQAGWDKRADLVVELVASMAESLGYKFSHNAIKRIAYLPQMMVDENDFVTEMRKQLISVTKGESALLVKVENSPVDF